MTSWRLDSRGGDIALNLKIYNIRKTPKTKKIEGFALGMCSRGKNIPGGEFSKGRDPKARECLVCWNGWKRPEEQKQDSEGVVAGGEVAEVAGVRQGELGGLVRS